jgi:predicted ATPase/DNA-binding winged helix-turn-helix (wHTH) protein
MEAGQEETQGLAVGRFRIFPRQRRIFAGDEPVELGSRAFDLLLALIEARGFLLSKDALINRVWPNRIVGENNLHAQIAALRSALGEDRELIRTVAGRGYQISGEVRSVSDAGQGRVSAGDAASRLAPTPTNLPQPMSDMIGRDVELREVLNLVGAHRLVTLTGTGGIGKTRIAYEAARQLLPQFPDGVWIAELSPLRDANLVPAAIAAAVGLDLASAEASAERVAAALAGKEVLIVLDTCEHVIDAATHVAEALLRACAKARVIATSREALKAHGEWGYRVKPLSLPAEDAIDPLECGSVSLFVERARAMQPGFNVDESSALVIAAICRRLDGIPLAIEMAAARAATLGVSNLAAHIDDQLRLLNCGRRTALPRHQTLRATLDWSHTLLTHSERSALRRLAMFHGAFELEAVKAVAGAAGAILEVTDDLTNLIAKSFVSVEVDDGNARYRLFETTRAYALEKLAESGEFDAVAQRHAEYYRRRAEVERKTRPIVQRFPAHARHIDKVRTAPDRAFSRASIQSACRHDEGVSRFSLPTRHRSL